mmetsp:Transcript_70388/g.117550  ORF Transcript_70388/g.117550 Transcript_70388/m.117550 type:complete len:101 (+) Transcript_70388:253-555(+)
MQHSHGAAVMQSACARDAFQSDDKGGSVAVHQCLHLSRNQNPSLCLEGQSGGVLTFNICSAVVLFVEVKMWACGQQPLFNSTSVIYCDRIPGLCSVSGSA